MELKQTESGDSLANSFKQFLKTLWIHAKIYKRLYNQSNQYNVLESCFPQLCIDHKI